MKCHFCSSELKLSNLRPNKTQQTGTCRTCKYQHLFQKKEGQMVLAAFQKRFSHNKNVWHFFHHIDFNETKFIKIQKRPLIKINLIDHEIPDPKFQRVQYVLSGFVSPERFINLLAFL